MGGSKAEKVAMKKNG